MKAANRPATATTRFNRPILRLIGLTNELVRALVWV